MYHTTVRNSTNPEELARQAEEITHRLGGRWLGAYGRARCPLHDDSSPSLTIRPGDASVLFVCHAGCDARAIARAVLDHEAPPPMEAPRFRTTDHTKDALEREAREAKRTPPTMVFKYITVSGRDITKRRWDYHSVVKNEPDKTMDWVGKGSAKVEPYGWREAKPIANQFGWTLVTEGEKDRDEWAATGLPAISIGGATNIGTLALDDPASTDTVFIYLPDVDEPGHKAAVAFQRAIQPARCVIAPMTAMSGTEGAADWLRKHGDLAVPRIKRIITHLTAPKVSAPVMAPNIDDEFWNSTALRRSIRAYARSRYLSADAVLAHILVRIAADLNPDVRVITPLGAASLNYMAAVVGLVAAGKSLAASCGAEIYRGGNAFNRLLARPVGSGQGIEEAYMGSRPPADDPDGKPVRQQVVRNGLFDADEVSHLLGILADDKSRLASVLCTAWIGRELGVTNANEDRRRLVEHYSLGFITTLLPAGIKPLIDMAGMGLPARFLYLSANDPAAAGKLGKPSAVPHITISRTTQIECDPSIHREVCQERELALIGQGTRGELDEHYNLLRYKTASLLALMEGHDIVTCDDWRDAGIILTTSSGVRDYAIETADIEEDVRIAADAARIAMRRKHIEDADGREQVMERNIRKHLDANPDITNKALRDKVCADKSERPLFRLVLPRVRADR